MTRTTAVMLSHASRAETYRPESLRALATAGIRPQVIESTYQGPTPDAEVRAKAYDALLLAQGGGLLFLEDDLDARPFLLPRHLALAEAAQVTTVLCAVNRRHYPPGVLDQPALKAELLPMPAYDADRGYHGSMAVYVPPALVQHGLERRHEFQQPDGSALTEPVIEPDHRRRKVTGFDFWLKDAACHHGGIFVAVPNSVDHVGANLRTGATWPSPSFHIQEAYDA